MMVEIIKTVSVEKLKRIIFVGNIGATTKRFSFLVEASELLSEGICLKYISFESYPSVGVWIGDN